MSKLATASWWMARIALLLAIAGPLLAHFGITRPLVGFGIFAISLGVGLLAVLVGLLGVWATRPSSGKTGRGRAWLGVGIGALLFSLAFGLASSARDAPPIHDITTSPERPPSFDQLASVDANLGRDLSYPHDVALGADEVARQQREAYPDLEPIPLAGPPLEALQKAAETGDELGWEVLEIDIPHLRLEATDTSRWFRFVDDIVIEAEATSDDETLLHVRSTSRDGRSDLGVNAQRIRRFREAIAD